MGGKARRERVMAARDNTIPLCKGANYHVFTLGASKCSMCGWNRYQERVSTHPNVRKSGQRLFAFWRYAAFPFVLGGEVKEFSSNGLVYIKSYQGCFRPIRVMLFDEGSKLWEKLSALREEQLKEIKALNADFKARAEELFEEKL